MPDSQPLFLFLLDASPSGVFVGGGEAGMKIRDVSFFNCPASILYLVGHNCCSSPLSWVKGGQVVACMWPLARAHVAN